MNNIHSSTLLLWLVTSTLISAQPSSPPLPQTAPQPPANIPAPQVDTTAASAEKKKNIKERIKDYEELKKKANARLKEIDAIIDPAKDALVSKVFEITPQEYAMLKLQAEVPDSAKKYFSAKNSDITTSRENIAKFFDEAYEAIKAGFLWYGQEQTLVQKDIELYNKMQNELTEALLATAKGSEYKALLDEKEKIKQELTNVDPVLLYHIGRRNWFRSFPDYKPALEDAVTSVKESGK